MSKKHLHNQHASNQKSYVFSFKKWFKANYLILIGLFSLIIIVFFNTFNNQFLSDDIDGIVNNPQITTLNYVFSHPMTFIQNSLYFLTEILFGKNATAYRLINNIFFHIGCVMLIYLLIKKLHSKSTALFASIIFAIHPIIVEPVVWISASSYPRSTFFLLLALIFIYFSKNRIKHILLGILSFTLALGSSEKTIFYPLILILFLNTFKSDIVHKKRLFIYSLVPIFIGMIYFVQGFLIRTKTLEQSYQTETSFINPILQIPIAISNYLTLYLWPDKLTLYHSEMIFTTWQYIIALVIFLSYVSAILISWKKNKQVLFWLMWFLLFLLPTLNPFGISWIVAERYVYGPIIGITVITAMLIDKLAQKEDRKYFILSFFCIWITVLGIRTIIRNNDWDNQDNLWLSAARTSPSSPQNHNNLGDYYGRQGDIETAINEFQTAIKLKPNYADAWHNLGNTYTQIQQWDKAIEALNNAVKYNPNLWQSHQLAAVIYYQQNNYPLAIEKMNEAIKIIPNLTSLWINRAIIYLASGEKLNAEQDLKKALELDPSNQQAKALMLEISK